MGTFTYRMLGFRTQPVDHCMRTYYLVAERRYKLQAPYCSGFVPRHQIMLQAMRQLLEAYPPAQLKFSFLFHSEYTHGHSNLLQWADADLRDHLEYLLTSGHLERSLLVLMSDHGARFQVYTHFPLHTYMHHELKSMPSFCHKFRRNSATRFFLIEFIEH